MAGFSFCKCRLWCIWQNAATAPIIGLQILRVVLRPVFLNISLGLTDTNIYPPRMHCTCSSLTNSILNML
jgi:hypothetical protein